MFQVEITGNSEDLSLMKLYNLPDRPTYISENGPRSFFPPVEQYPNTVFFDGTNWISYDISRIREEMLRHNTREELHLTFRATDADSPIWYSSDDDRDILVTLQVEITVVICTALVYIEIY